MARIADRTAADVATTARHESGHCVVAVKLHVRVVSASVVATSEENGSVCYDRPADPRDDLCVAMAGRLAVLGAGESLDLSGPDWEIATRALDRLGERLGGPAWTAALARTEGLLTAHRGLVVALADELQRRQVMTGAEVRAFVAGHRAPKAVAPQTPPAPDEALMARCRMGAAEALSLTSFGVRGVGVVLCDGAAQVTRPPTDIRWTEQAGHVATLVALAAARRCSGPEWERGRERDPADYADAEQWWGLYAGIVDGLAASLRKNGRLTEWDLAEATVVPLRR